MYADPRRTALCVLPWKAFFARTGSSPGMCSEAAGDLPLTSIPYNRTGGVAGRVFLWRNAVPRSTRDWHSGNGCPSEKVRPQASNRGPGPTCAAPADHTRLPGSPPERERSRQSAAEVGLSAAHCGSRQAPTPKQRFLSEGRRKPVPASASAGAGLWSSDGKVPLRMADLSANAPDTPSDMGNPGIPDHRRKSASCCSPWLSSACP